MTDKSADTIPMYSPELDEIVPVPAADKNMYLAGGYALGDAASEAATAKHLESPAVALMDISNALGLGLPKAILSHTNPAMMKQFAKVEENHPYIKAASEIAGSVAPFALGAGAGGALIKGLAGRMLGSGAVGAVEGATGAITNANINDSPLTIEQLATAMGIGGMVGAAGEAGAHVISRLSSKISRSVASYLEGLSKKPYFDTTVIDPITQAYKPTITPRDMSANIDSVLGAEAEPLFGAAGEPKPQPLGPPPMPPKGEAPTLSADEFSYAPTESQLTDRQVSEAVSRKGYKDATAREVERMAQSRTAGDAATFDAYENEIRRNSLTDEGDFSGGNEYENNILRSMRDEDLGRYVDREPPTTRKLTNEEYFQQFAKNASTPQEAIDRIGAYEGERAAAKAGDAVPGAVELPKVSDDILTDNKLPKLPPSDFKARAARIPTGRQLGKQLLRDMPPPPLPSEAALADSAAGNGAVDEIRGKLANDPPLRTDYRFKPGMGPTGDLGDAAKKFVYGSFNPLFGGHHGNAYGAYKAAGSIFTAAQKTAELGLLKQRAAVEGIVNYMTAGPSKAVGAAAKAILQGQTNEISSTFLPGDVDENYATIADGISKLAANPERVQQYVQQRYGPLLAGQPTMLAQVTAHQTAKIQHLSQLLPQSSAPVSIFTDPYEPARTDKLKYLAHFKAVNDPLNAMLDPTSDIIETIKATSPQLHNQLIGVLQGALSDPKVRKKLSNRQTAQISTLLGANVRAYDAPQFVAGLQQAAQANTAQAQPAAPAPPKAGSAAKPINLGKQQGSFVSSVAPPSMQDQLDDVGAT